MSADVPAGLPVVYQLRNPCGSGGRFMLDLSTYTETTTPVVILEDAKDDNYARAALEGLRSLATMSIDIQMSPKVWGMYVYVWPRLYARQLLEVAYGADGRAGMHLRYSTLEGILLHGGAGCTIDRELREQFVYCELKRTCMP